VGTEMGFGVEGVLLHALQNEIEVIIEFLGNGD